MKIVNQEVWEDWIKNNEEDYGKAIVEYAERWADMMEKEMENGKELEDIAESCSNDADTEGITGFMYGAAVVVLTSCWEHGERLRCWHNITTQIGDEGERANEGGGVLNPALLAIGEDKA